MLKFRSMSKRSNLLPNSDKIVNLVHLPRKERLQTNRLRRDNLPKKVRWQINLSG